MQVHEDLITLVYTVNKTNCDESIHKASHWLDSVHMANDEEVFSSLDVSVLAEQ